MHKAGIAPSFRSTLLSQSLFFFVDTCTNNHEATCMHARFMHAVGSLKADVERPEPPARVSGETQKG